MRDRYIISQWCRTWLAACALCLAACGREAGTFSVSFGFTGEKPDPDTEYSVYVRVKDEHWTTVAESPKAVFDPEARLHFPSVRNGDAYTIVVELHTLDNDRIAFFGRSKPFDLHAGAHVDVQVELEIQTVPRGVLRILDARGSGNVRSKVRDRHVTLAFTAEGAIEATLANDEKLKRGRTTRPLSELSQEDGEYRWPSWDLDAEQCDEPPCLDGEREVYLQLTNSTGYHSEPVRTDIELDTTPPELTSHRIEPMTAADGVPTTLQVIANEPLSAIPEVSVLPADFSLTPNPESAVPGETFSFHYTVDAQALDQQAYQFQVKLVDIAGNENEVSLGGASELRIESELRALSTAIERIPAFAPFAGVPVFSRTDPVSGEPVRVRVTVESSRPYDDTELRLVAQDGKGHTLDFEYAAADSDKIHAVFTRALSAEDVSGSYALQLDWRDRSGRIGDPDGLRSFTISDAPKELRWGVVDSSLDEHGEPRTLYTARPWGAQTASGHSALGDSLRGRVIQHAERAEDCIAQLLIYGDASSDGTPRPASLLSVAEVNDVSARGCNTDSSTFDVKFSGHSDYHLYVVPVTASGHRGPAQSIAHNEWVATLPEAVSGGTAAYPHQLLAHMLPPTLPLKAAEPVRLPVKSDAVPYAGNWEQRSSSLLRPQRDLGDMAAVYDPNHGRSLLLTRLAGDNASSVWQWDGSTWSVSRSTTYLTTTVQAFAYDRARDRFLVVGGGHWMVEEDGHTTKWIPESKTWEWDGSDWAEQHPEHALSAELRALAYDPARKRSVGLGVDGRTWEWDGADWLEGAAFPMLEDAAAVRMAYDEARKCLVAIASRPEGTRTFEYARSEWVERMSQKTPPGFANVLVAYDNARKRIVLHGGEAGSWKGVIASDVSTWQWDGVDWSQIASTERPIHECFSLLDDGADRGVSLLCGQATVTERWRLHADGWSAEALPTAPPARANAGMSYDERRKCAVLVGGDSVEREVQGRTWELTGSTWQERAPTSAESVRVSGAARAMTYDAARGVSLYLSPVFSNDSTEAPGSELIMYDGVGWQSVPVPELFGRSSYAIAYDPTRERTVVFSGFPAELDAEPLTDTWEWDGTRWLQAPTETAPRARQDHAMVFDAARKHILLFGGTAYSPDPLDDTWAWDGRTWTQLLATQSPPARKRHALAFDAERGRAVLFGGMHRTGDAMGPLNDTWEWDGSTWTQMITSAAPLARSGHSMVYDPERKRVLLYGGETPNSAGLESTKLGDLWSWDGTQWVELEVDALPSLHGKPSLAYDPERKQTVMFGGSDLSHADQQATVTWIWDGAQWLRKTVPAPSARNEAAMAFEPQSRRVMLSGGFNRTGRLSDTWTWDGAAWNRVSESEPQGKTRALMYDSKLERMLLVLDGATFTWQDNTWQPLAASNFGVNFSVEALGYDRGRERGVLAASQSPEGGGTVTYLAFEWDGSTWQSRTAFKGLLTYDSRRRRLVQVNDDWISEKNVLSDVEADGLRTLTVPTSPVLKEGAAIAYDEARRQLLLVGVGQQETRNDVQTWVWSSFEPAHQVLIDLKPLFGSGRTTDVVLDGFAFHAKGGASAATEDASNPGMALELWNGRAFQRVQENEADFDAAGALCFESHDPAVLGALEVDKRWPFVLRPAADSDGPEPPQLHTKAFEVRVRYHLRGAAPALPPEPGSLGKRCAADGWAMRDMGAGR